MRQQTVTKAQQRHVFRAGGPPGDPVYVWLGNNYVPGAGGAGTCTNEGLLYFSPLRFAANGSIEQMEWREKVSFPA